MGDNKNDKSSGKLVVSMDSLTEAHRFNPVMKQAAQAVKRTEVNLKKTIPIKSNNEPNKRNK